MIASRIGWIVLLTLASPLRAEPEYPAAAEFVASMELSISVCSKRAPTKASQYAAIRAVANQLFAKRNYDAYVGTTDYLAAYDKLFADLKDTPERELAQHCEAVLLLLRAPPQGIFYRD